MDELRATNVSLAAVCFGDSLKTRAMPVDDFLDAAVKHGLGAVELCDLTITDPDALVGKLTRRGLRQPSVALRNDFTVPAADLDGQIEHLLTWIPPVRKMGGTVARVWSGWQRDDDEARKQVLTAFDTVVPAAAAAGVTLALETHGGASNDPRFAAELIGRHPAGTIGVCLDFGNLPAADRRSLISAFVPMTVHVHVKTHDFVDGREPTIPVEWAVEQLAEARYQGQWVLEYEGRPPYDEGIQHTLAVLERADVISTAVTAGRPDAAR